MLMFCSTGRACLGMLLVDIISGQRYEFRECSSSSTSSSGNSLKYTVIVPGYRDRINICMYLYSNSIIVVHLWGWLSMVQVVRYSAIETPSIGSIERVVSVANILLPYRFRLANTAALLIEGPLQLNSTQLTTAQHKAITPTPNPTTAQLAGGKRSNDGRQPGTLCGHRELCSDTLVARLTCPLYPVWTRCFKTILLFSITCTEVLHVRQCTTSGLPHESRDIFRALKMNLARGQARLCGCDFIFYSQRHAPRTINRPRARSSYIHFYIDSILFFFG